MSTLKVNYTAGLPWRDDEGRTMAQCMADWLDHLPASHFPPLVEPHARRAIERGQICGVRVVSDDHKGADYLVMPAALSAYVASLGLPCETPAALHEALGDVVEAGHLSDTLEAHRLPVMGKIWLYRMRASVLQELDP